MNKVILKGCIASDVTIRNGKNDKKFCPFSLAYVSPNKGVEEHCFIDCIAFNKTSDYIANYAPKGTLVYIEGVLNERKFARQDGSKGSKTEVIVEHIEILKRKDEKATEPEAPSEQASEMPDEDLPF